MATFLVLEMFVSERPSATAGSSAGYNCLPRHASWSWNGQGPYPSSPATGVPAAALDWVVWLLARDHE